MQRISSEQRSLAKVKDRLFPRGETREQKIRRVRQEIREGTYDEESRIEAILDRLEAELGKRK